MHNNYFFLRLLSKQLNEEFIGSAIEEIFSQQKNELVFSLSHEGKERYIRAYLSPEFCCLSFPDSFQRARKNSVDLFPSVIGQKIEEVVQVEQDRSFYFKLYNELFLLFKMHGNRSNVLVISEDEVIDLFKNSLKQDRQLDPSSLIGEANTDRSSFEQKDANYKALVPTFGKSFDAYFAQKLFFEADMDERYRIFVELIHYLERPTIYLHQSPTGLPQLNLYEISVQDVRMSDPIESLNKFFREYISSYSLEREKRHAANQVLSQLKKCDSYIYKSTSKLQQLQTALNYRHLADLIMAHLHEIKPYSSSIEVVDFYSNQPVNIKLNPTLSPQHNAERYYRKAKKQQLEIDSMQSNIDHKSLQKQKLEQQLLAIKSATDLSWFKKKKSHGNSQVELPYHLVDFMDYEIMVGKNAVKNEKLTFQVAKKDDLFLHAKDTSGSHVIVRKKSNQNFPKPVIEFAASLAAYYSKSRSESLCRVLFTARKYVRKVKGGPAGAVIIDREQIILVPPKSLQQI